MLPWKGGVTYEQFSEQAWL